MRSSISRATAILVTTLLLPLTCCSSSLAAGLGPKITPLVERHRGDVAVAIKHLETGEEYYHRADAPMPTASLIKFPVMVEAYRQAAEGQVDLKKEITLASDDKVPGSGILTSHFSDGAKLTLRDAIRLMIVFSDNTATNLVVDQIGLPATAQHMRSLGLPNTQLHAKVYRRDTSIAPERSREFGLGSTTAREMLRLFEMLHREELGSSDTCRQMMDHLLSCDDDTKLQRGLPAGTKLAHKTGAVTRRRCDAGIILSPKGPIVVCVLTSKNEDRRFSSDNDAHKLCRDIAKATFEHFNPAGTEELAADSVLSNGAFGRIVEDLQRTLNKRLTPSPGLSIDGDFGPATEAAVKQFQRQEQITVTGLVDGRTWEALGTLISGERPVPPPDQVNSASLPQQKQDPLLGKPFVTCKAWAIADEHGKLLWSENAESSLDIASTTKIMTAYVVLKFASEHPEVLDEEMVFSRRADQTRGSTAAIRAGERLPVRETLFGLLLPSGNDASVALGEHFGARLPLTDSATQPEDPLERFVVQMNLEAKSLGMNNSGFRNPHGLTAKGHQSSAADLIKLATAAWQYPEFRRYVATRQHGYTVTGPGGYRRDVMWKNTNRLLGIAGFGGIKTGTTSAAGACLVSTAERDGRRLFMVVLGAQSSTARYVDSRNLYRWAWTQSE